MEGTVSWVAVEVGTASKALCISFLDRTGLVVMSRGIFDEGLGEAFRPSWPPASSPTFRISKSLAKMLATVKPRRVSVSSGSEDEGWLGLSRLDWRWL